MLQLCGRNAVFVKRFVRVSKWHWPKWQLRRTARRRNAVSANCPVPVPKSLSKLVNVDALWPPIVIWPNHRRFVGNKIRTVLVYN